MKRFELDIRCLDVKFVDFLFASFLSRMLASKFSLERRIDIGTSEWILYVLRIPPNVAIKGEHLKSVLKLTLVNVCYILFDSNI